MNRFAFYSIVLMALGVILSACDTAPPPTTPTPNFVPAGTPQQRLIFEVTPLKGEPDVTQGQYESAQSILQKRLEVMELASTTVQVSGTTLVVTIPTATDLEEVKTYLTQTGSIEFLNGSSNPPQTGVYIVTELGSPEPEASPIDKSGVVYPVILTNEDLQIGTANVITLSNMPNMEFTLTEAGKTRLADYTRANIGTFMPIALDKKVLVSPVIQSEITGGKMALAGLQDVELRSLLISANSGVLPVQLTFTTAEEK